LTLTEIANKNKTLPLAQQISMAMTEKKINEQLIGHFFHSLNSFVF